MNKKTNKEVKEIIDIEGLGYAICCYLNSTDIEDKKLAKWWKEAQVAMNKIEKHLHINQ